jgi:methionine-gamma-lyase
MTRFDTLAVHAGDEPDASTGALDPAVVFSSTFAFEDAAEAAARIAGTRPGMVYGRWANPTVRAFEQKVAALEGAADAVALASGMAAIHAIFGALCASGDRVVAPKSVYAETTRLLTKHFGRYGVLSEFVDATNLAELDRASAGAKILYVETPANPTMAITDLRAAAEIAHKHGAILVVDSTFATPYHQRPLELGADLVVHSATKALCGHGDAIGGVVAGESALLDKVRELGTRTAGGILSPMTAMLLSRGVRTLGIRMAKASATTLDLARRLSEHRAVERVYYPGLPTDPGHAIAAKQMQRGFGAILAFEVRGGREVGARAYDRVQLIERAVSLGDVRSLLTHAASTTHASLSPAERAAGGVGEGLMRLSVGIEDLEDLWADLEQALA